MLWDIVSELLVPAAIIGAGWRAWIIQRQIAAENSKLQRRLAAQNFTFQFIAGQEFQPEWRESRKIFYQHGTNLMSFMKNPEASHAEKTSLLRFLSYYELMGLGIRRKTLDEKLCKEWSQEHVVNIWKTVSSYVHSRRTSLHNARVYSELEWLANRWSSS